MAKTEGKKVVKDEVVVEEAQSTAAAQTLATKTAMMSGILQVMATMSHDQMMQWFPDALALAAPVGDPAAQNQASIAMKPSAASAMQEDVKSLFSTEDLNEEAQSKIVSLIEQAVELQTNILKEEMEEQYGARLVEEVAKLQEELVDKVDGYVTYAVEQWVETNQVAITSALRVAKADRILEGLTALMKDAGQEIPEAELSVVEALEAENAELKRKLDEQLEEAVEAREKVVAEVARSVFKEVSEGLTLLEVDRFKKLVEDVEVDIPEDELREKLKLVRESHFRKDKPAVTKVARQGLTEAIVEQESNQEVKEEEVTPPSDDNLINMYVRAIDAGSNRFVRGPYAK